MRKQHSKHHDADARRALLEIFLQRMRLIPGGVYDKRLLAMCSADVLKAVEDGIRAALDGKRDPFKLSKRGLKPKLTRQQELDAIRDVQSGPFGETQEQAFERVGERFNTSASVIRDAFADRAKREWAELQGQYEKKR